MVLSINLGALVFLAACAADIAPSPTYDTEGKPVFIIEETQTDLTFQYPHHLGVGGILEDDELADYAADVVRANRKIGEPNQLSAYLIEHLMNDKNEVTHLLLLLTNRTSRQIYEAELFLTIGNRTTDTYLANEQKSILGEDDFTEQGLAPNVATVFALPLSDEQANEFISIPLKDLYFLAKSTIQQE